MGLPALVRHISTYTMLGIEQVIFRISQILHNDFPPDYRHIYNTIAKNVANKIDGPVVLYHHVSDCCHKL